MSRPSTPQSSNDAGIAHDPDFLTVREVAKRLRCSDKTIRRRIASGRLRALRHDGRLLVPIADYWSYVDHLRRRSRQGWPAPTGLVQA